MSALAVGWYADRSRLAREIESRRQIELFDELCLSVTRREYETRRDGVSSLHANGGDSVVAPLIYALGDPEIKIARAARDALEDLTGESFSTTVAQNADIEIALAEMCDEWGRWIKWYENKYNDVDVETLPLFEMYVQSSLQKTDTAQE